MIRFQFDLPVAARGTLARVLWLAGISGSGHAHGKGQCEDAHAIARVASVSLYWALDAACVIALTVGDLATAEQSLAMLLEHAVRHALGFWQALCHSYEGELLIKRGDAASGIRCLRIGLHELQMPGTFCVSEASQCAGGRHGGCRASGAGPGCDR